VTVADDPVRRALLRRGFALEYATLAWNVAGIVVLAMAAISARSVALAGFALDSLIEIGASSVVIWELSGAGEERQRRGLRLIGYALAALAVYLLVQSTVVLATGYHPHHSVPGILWTAVTAGVMFALAAGKTHTGRALGNPVLRCWAVLLPPIDAGVDGRQPHGLRCCLRLYEAVTGPAAVFHLKLVPDVPPISPATQNWLVVPDLGAAAL
jgi:hypothetical protein